jgi:hypothetical protein
MPGQLCNTSTGYCAINDVTHETLESAEHVTKFHLYLFLTLLFELRKTFATCFGLISHDDFQG